MKSKISLFNKSEFNSSLFNKAVFKQNVRECWGIWAGLLIVWLIFLPLVLYYRLEGFAAYAEKTSEAYHEMLVNTMITALLKMNGIFIMTFAVSAIAAAMAVFSYLFKARNCNMMHTFPLSRLSLFVTNYVCGLLFLIVPLLIGTAGSMLIGAGFGAVDAVSVRCYAVWMGTAVLENMFFFSMAVCMLMFVGNIVAAPILYLILNFLYAGCQLIWQGMTAAVCYGLTGSMINLNILTPIVYMQRHIGIQSRSMDDAFQYPFYGGKDLAAYTAAAAAFLVIAVIVYKKKHVETAGDVITVGWMKPVFRWGVAICTSALGALFISSTLYSNSFAVILISAVVIGVLSFFFAQMLLERSVHVFRAARIRECVIYTVFLCICYIGLDADILGFESRVPLISEVQSVRMAGAGIELYTKDAGEMEWVQDIHRQIIDHKNEFERTADRSSAYVRIDYDLKDGSSLSRSYNIPYNDAAESVAGRIHAYAVQPDVVLKKYFGIHYPDITVFGGTFYNTSNGDEVRLSEKDAQQIYQAVIKDAQAGNLESEEETGYQIGELMLNVRDEAGFESYGSSYSMVQKVQKDSDVSIMIEDASCQNVKRVMKKLGYL